MVINSNRIWSSASEAMDYKNKVRHGLGLAVLYIASGIEVQYTSMHTYVSMYICVGLLKSICFD